MTGLFITLDNDVVINGLHFIHVGKSECKNTLQVSCFKIIELTLQGKFKPLYSDDTLEECREITEKRIKNGSIGRPERDKYLAWAREGVRGRMSVNTSGYSPDDNDGKFFHGSLLSADFLVTCNEKDLKENNLLNKVLTKRKTVNPIEFVRILKGNGIVVGN